MRKLDHATLKAIRIRACEQIEMVPERVTRWRTEKYPAIRDEAAHLAATVYFADEAGVRSDYHAGTTWAPVGQTPIVPTIGTRHSINMISAVTVKRSDALHDLHGEDECRRVHRLLPRSAP